MRENKIDAIYLEPGSSMFYYTGMRWGTSERMFALVIPARGEIAWVCPKFEEERARELIKMGKDIRTWEEDESPYQRVAEIFRDRGIRTGRIGMEERVRFFLFDGIRKAAPRLAIRQRDTDHRRLPHVQIAGGNRAHATGERHDDRRLPGHHRQHARRYDAGRVFRQLRRRISRARRAGRRLLQLWQVHGVSRTAAARRRN